MPGLGGKELAAKLMDSFPGTRILLTSGYAAGATNDVGLHSAGGHFLPKPYSVELLARKVREVLDTVSAAAP